MPMITQKHANLQYSTKMARGQANRQFIVPSQTKPTPHNAPTNLIAPAALH